MCPYYRALEILAFGWSRYSHEYIAEISGIYVPSSQDILDQILQGSRTISFRDFQALLSALGFTLVRQRGSHRIYHARTGRPFPIQPDGQDAKHYQVRQLRDMIGKHGLTLDKSE
jgi:hypothetical protein